MGCNSYAFTHAYRRELTKALDSCALALYGRKGCLQGLFVVVVVVVRGVWSGKSVSVCVRACPRMHALKAGRQVVLLPPAGTAVHVYPQ